VIEDGETGLTWVIRNQESDYALRLIGLGANCDTITKANTTPLSLACKWNLPEVAQELLNKNNDEGSPALGEEHINITGADGENALTCAINNKMEDIALELLKKGAYCDITTDQGHTPLFLACTFELAEVAREILKKGSAISKYHINAADELGRTDLTMAICYQWSDISLELLRLGAQRDVITERGRIQPQLLTECGWTPLSLACYWGLPEVAQELLKLKDGDEGLSEDHINLPNADGHTALTWAVMNNLPEVVVQLLHHGASMQDAYKKVIEIKSEDFLTYLNERVTVDKPKGGKKSDEMLVLNYKLLSRGGQDQTPILHSILELSPQHRQLVKHPLVQAFLMMKWEKMKPWWRGWIILKIIFFLFIVIFAIVLYTSSGPGAGKVEPQVLEAPTRECQNMTLPGVLTVKTPPNSTLESMQVCFATLIPKPKDAQPNSLKFFSDSEWWLITAQVFFALFTLFFSVVELIQFASSVKVWAAQKKNWLQAVILMISIILSCAMFSGQSPDHMMTHLVATLLPMAYYEGLYEVGYHYKYSKYINLFKRVLKTFCKYFVVYIGFIVCFAGGYAIMLPPPGTNSFPHTFWGLLPKAFVMLTGEQEFMNIPFTNTAGYRIWETLYFLVFLMLTVVILINMLNGLAVAEARTMLEDSETDSLCSLLGTAAFWDRTTGREEKTLQNAMCHVPCACDRLFTFLQCALNCVSCWPKGPLAKFHVLKHVTPNTKHTKHTKHEIQYFFPVFKGNYETYAGMFSRNSSVDTGFTLGKELTKMALEIIHTRDITEDMKRKENEEGRNRAKEREQEKEERDKERGEINRMIERLQQLIEKIENKSESESESESHCSY